MDEQFVIDIGVKSVWLAIKIASPALVATLVIGLLVSVFQAATQINEQTLTFVPKIVAVLGIFAALFPWMMQLMMEFSGQAIMT